MQGVENSDNTTGLEIAVIGMAGRFPGASDIAEFWDNLKNGVESISFFTSEELVEAGVDSGLLKDPNYIKAGGVLRDSDYFDSAFFGYTAVEAELMDPQVRIFHECAWEALEDACCVPGAYKGRIGVYAGASAHLEWELSALLSGGADLLGGFAAWQLYDKDFMSTRVSYSLDLRGPVVNIHTACSTSLVAIHMACQGLLGGECHMALAGGVTVSNLGKEGYMYREGLVSSPDGHCRAFDTGAKGTTFGQGVGIVVLKPLENAIADRDFIHAVIKSTAVNNDGKAKVGYTAPSVGQQAAAIRKALRAGRVGAESIGYIEAHGTATELGDPVEIEALKQAFNTDKKGFCRIGSVKSNIGHTDVAAGVAGFIKTVLALKHRQIPPSLHFETPNPKIDFKNSPFSVNTRLTPWENNGYPLRAGVSSFGVGGTNAHVILEEAMIPRDVPGSRQKQLLVLSACSEASLDKAAENLSVFLKNNPAISLPDVAYTLQLGRKAFKYRRIAVCRDTGEALDVLNESPAPPCSVVRSENPPVIFMFPGQGSQYAGMGAGLYRTETVFRDEMDRCFEILDPLLGYRVKDILYPSPGGDNKSYSEKILQTEVAQPVLFLFEYALAKLLMSWGIRPYALIGHSIGEYVAACLSGVFSLEDALEIVALRGRLMQELPTGSMLTVSMSPDDLLQLIRSKEGISTAALNSPSLCVVSGPHEAIHSFSKELTGMGHENRPIHTSHAFHSAMMEPVLKEFEANLKRFHLNKPRIPYISNVTGTWITAGDAMDPAYWAVHLRKTVQFSGGVQELLKKESSIFLEVGPGKVLSTFVRQHIKHGYQGKEDTFFTSELVRHPKMEAGDDAFLLNKIGRLWLRGAAIDWAGFYSGEKRNKVPLPTYPFERLRFPAAGDTFTLRRKLLSRAPGAMEKKKDITQWSYIPLWEKSIQVPQKNAELPAAVNRLVFVDNHGPGNRINRLIEELERPAVSSRITVVRTGSQFSRTGDREFCIHPGRESDYDELFRQLSQSDALPRSILHLWNITGDNADPTGLDGINRTLDPGFYSLLYIARALGKYAPGDDIQIGVVTDNMQDVLGVEELRPGKAAVLGAIKVIPLEYPNIRCCSMDIVLPEPGSRQEAKLILHLLREFETGFSDRVVAFRGMHRWVQVVKPFPLNEAPAGKSTLTERGVYLITGGMGGIGLTLAEYLTRSVSARVILTGRSFFPLREKWEEWLSSHIEHNVISEKIRKLTGMEKSGGEVRVYRADVADPEQMKNLVARIRKEFGQINGVIHSAGLPDGGVVQLRTREMSEKVFDSKIRGTLILDDLMGNEPLDFFVLCSSLTSLLPAMGQVAYSAANAFLDAFAAYKHSTRDDNNGCTVSVNWDAWRDVGMAARAVKQAAGSAGVPVGEPLDVAHPLFDYCMETGLNERTYVTYFSAENHWVLDEHRIINGKPTLPGTGCVEIARAAFNHFTGSQFMEIRSLNFLTPLRMEENEEKEVLTILQKAGDGYTFSIKSRLHSMYSMEDKWLEHAVGEIEEIVETPEIRKYDIKELMAGCNEGEIDFTGEISESEKSRGDLNIIFGPRWENIKKVYFGAHQVLILLELSRDFAGDIGVYQMHPALFDTGAGYYTQKNLGEEISLPFSYDRITIKAPIPRRFYSFQEYEDETLEGEKIRRYSIRFMDEQGVELVNIKDYKRLTLSEHAIARLMQNTGNLQEEAAAPISINTSSREEFLKHGILPAEGAEVFERILGKQVPQVVISTRDPGILIEESNNASGGMDVLKQLELEEESRISARPLQQRPELRQDYVAPESEIEKKITKIWQNFFGIEPIGMYDDFFELGGDSLKLMSMVSRIHKELEVEIPLGNLFNAPTPAGITAYIKSAKKIKYSSIEPIEKKEYYFLSSAQKRIYFVQQMDLGSTAYNVPLILELEKSLGKEKLENIFREFIDRHESLRTYFELVEDEPVQRIHAGVGFEIDYYETTGEEQSAARIIQRFIRPFDLSQAPLFRVGVLRTHGEDRFLIVDIHHIIADGVSMEILSKEFIALNSGEVLPPLRLQYKDYAHWQNRQIESGEFKKQEGYWLERFKHPLPSLNLPTDYPRTGTSSPGGRVYFEISAELTGKIRKLVSETGSTLFIFLLAVFYILLSRYADREDIAIGCPVANRTHGDLNNIIGMFINMLAMRNLPASWKTFRQFLEEVKENSIKAYENQGYPFEELVNKLAGPRKIDRNPLTDVAFGMMELAPELEDSGVGEDAGRGLDDEFLQNGIVRYDIELMAVETRESVILHFDYRSDLFKKETMEKKVRHFLKIVEDVITDPGIKISRIEMLDKAEMAELKRLLVNETNENSTVRNKMEAGFDF